MWKKIVKYINQNVDDINIKYKNYTITMDSLYFKRNMVIYYLYVFIFILIIFLIQTIFLKCIFIYENYRNTWHCKTLKTHSDYSNYNNKIPNTTRHNFFRKNNLDKNYSDFIEPFPYEKFFNR